MYVCMYVCMYVSMYICTYICMFLCTYVCMYVCMYVCIHVCMYVCIYVCVYVVDVVDQFKYLGSLVEARGCVVAEVSNRIAQASMAFGSLRYSVFTASELTLETKRLVYRSVVLGVWLYGAEAWAPTQELVRKLDCFH